LAVFNFEVTLNFPALGKLGGDVRPCFKRLADRHPAAGFCQSASAVSAAAASRAWPLTPPTADAASLALDIAGPWCSAASISWHWMSLSFTVHSRALVWRARGAAGAFLLQRPRYVDLFFRAKTEIAMDMLVS
jgi:hypothetical protein